MSRWKSTITTRNLGFGAVVLLAMAVAACQGSGSAGTLVSLAVTPNQPTIAKGTKLQFTATGTFGDGSTQDLTSQVSWRANEVKLNVGAATISATGLAFGNAEGQSTIAATYMNVTGSTLLTVGVATPVSLNVTPSNPSIANGTSVQFVAKATLTDGTSQDVSKTATWTTASTTGTNVATISATGMATGGGVGQAMVTATYMEVSASVNLTVTSAVITSLNVTPSNPSVARGTMQQYTATATFTDATTQDVTQNTTWTALDLAPSVNVASVDATGLAVGKNLGGATITATFSGKSATARLTVTPAVLSSIAVSPSAPSIAKGTTQQLTATGTFTDGTTQDLTQTATWTAADVAPAVNVASVTPAGLATAQNIGTATLTATSSGKSGSATLVVTPAVVVSVRVSPNGPSIAKGTMEQFSATATLSDATTQDATSAATWTATDVTGTGVASVDGMGLATGTNVGVATIRATYLGFNGTATLTVTAAVVNKVTVSPSAPSIARGTGEQFTATATLSDNTTQDVTDAATWTAVDITGTNVASIDNKGLATGTNVGTATVRATYLGFSGTVTLTVTAAVVTKITLDPAFASIAKGTGQQFTAMATLSDTTTQDVTNLAVWTTTDVTGTNVASIDMVGLATGNNVGVATITATYLGSSNNATLTVTAAVITKIAVTPATASIAKGVTRQFTATATLSDATTQDVTNDAVWTATDVTGTGVTSINTSGLATGATVGTATVTATYAGFSSNATLTVTTAVPMSIIITPATLNIPLNMVVQLTATLVYSDSSTVDVTATGAWDSANPATATVTASGTTGGRARGVAAGTVTLRVVANGITGMITATVSPCHVTVNEVQTDGTGGGRDEFVELYNGCSFAVDLNNARLNYRSSGGTLSVLFQHSVTTTIAAGGFRLYAGNAYTGVVPADGVMSTGLNVMGGAVGVSYLSTYTGEASELIVDSVGWGTAANVYVEGTVAPVPASASSIRRRPDGTDTNNNSSDFAVTATPTPRATNG